MILATQTLQPTAPSPAQQEQAVPAQPNTSSEELVELSHQQQAEHQLEHIVGKVVYYGNRALSLLLTLYAARGLWSSVEFTLVTIPEMEAKLNVGSITRAEVNSITVMAVVLMITTLISIILAWRLHKVRTETGPTLDLLVSLLFLGLSTVLESYVSMIDFVSLLDTLL